MTSTFQEVQHPRGPHGEWVKKALQSIKGKTPPKSFKFYKQGYKPKTVGAKAHQYGKVLYNAKKAGHFANDYELWLFAQKLAADAKKKHPSTAPTPHNVVNAAFHHEIADTGSLNMLGTTGVTSNLGMPKHPRGKTKGGIGVVSKHAPPGTLTKFVKTMKGASGAQLWVDDKGQEWLVKGNKPGSQAYGVKFAVALEEALAKIQSKAGLRSATSHKTTLDGKEVLAQKMFGDVKVAFPNGPDISTMSDEDKLEMQKQQIFDWVVSNWDTHTGNFLKDNEGIIGIDKGQGFKFFGKDKLDWNYVPVTPLGSDKLTYSPMWKDYIAGKGDMFTFSNSPELLKFAHRLQGIDDDEYKNLLRPYAEAAAKQGILAGGLKPDQFLEKAVARKNNVVNDFATFFGKAADAKVPKKVPETLEELSPKGMGVGTSFATTANPDNVLDAWQSDTISTDEFTQWIKTSDSISLDDLQFWKANGKISQNQFNTFKDAFDAGAGMPTSKTPPAGYYIVEHPTELDKFAIKKPSGEFSKSSGGEVKSWATKELAAGSSTMAKYKAQSEQQAKAGMAGAQAFAANAPENDPSVLGHLTGSDALEYTQLKTKIAAGEGHTPDEYMKLKSWVSQIQNSAKAAGAAQVEHDFEPSGFATPATQQPAKKTKGGFKEKPKFKISGGAPPSLGAAKGPNAFDDGNKLWEMKKAGEIADDYKMWSQAKKLSNLAKKKAGPNAQVGVDYSSPNQIRNVAMRLEFDETGDVVWETTAEKTSEQVGQTVSQIKKTVALHEHVPVVKASAAHTIPKQATAQFPGHWDASAVVGSYTNPHSFKPGDTQAIQGYGYKYTDHNKPWAQAQKSAWYNFSGGGSGNVNTFFRTGEVGLYGDVADAKKRAKAIVDTFKSDNVKPLEDWTVVTRGTNGGWEFGIGSNTVSFEQLQGMVGKVVRNKCPVSSSLRGRPAFPGSHRITYKLPPGFRGLGIYGHSQHGPENEMILPPGMAYRVLEVKKGNEDYQNEILVEVVDVKLPEIV